jgi:hypothetical protein
MALALASTLPEESWTIVAHFNGEYRMLHQTFPPVGSREEAMERAKVRVMSDERLWGKLRGSGLFPVEIRSGWVVPATRHERMARARKGAV